MLPAHGKKNSSATAVIWCEQTKGVSNRVASVVVLWQNSSVVYVVHRASSVLISSSASGRKRDYPHVIDIHTVYVTEEESPATND